MPELLKSMPGLNDVPDLFDHALTGYTQKGALFLWPTVSFLKNRIRKKILSKSLEGEHQHGNRR